jgi:general secretion pathway protein I
MTRRRGFTLLEVMVAVAILAIGLSAVFSAEAGSIRTAQRARKIGLATLLVRCKMGEIEEELAVKGLPAVFASESDKCCKDAEIEGYECKWEVQPIVLPDTMFGDEEDKDKDKPGSAKPGSGGLASGPGASPSGAAPSGDGSKGGLSGLVGAASAALGFKKGGDDKSATEPGKDKDGKDKTGKDKDGKDPILKQDPKDVLSGDPTRLLSGGGGGEVDAITAMAMQFVYPVLKPSFQSQIRRVTVTVSWPEGQTEKSFDVTQYIVAEQPVPLATDPNNPNALLGAPGATGSGTSTGSSATGTPTR